MMVIVQYVLQSMVYDGCSIVRIIAYGILWLQYSVYYNMVICSRINTHKGYRG